MKGELSALLADAKAALEQAGARYALIGGCARNVYASPRATKGGEALARARPALRAARRLTP